MRAVGMAERAMEESWTAGGGEGGGWGGKGGGRGRGRGRERGREGGRGREGKEKEEGGSEC